MTKTMLARLFVLLALLEPVAAFEASRCVSFSTAAARPKVFGKVFEVSTRPTTVKLSYDEELPKFSSDIVPKGDKDDTDGAAKSKKKNDGKLLEQLNEFGLSLKSKAAAVNSTAGEATKKKSQIALKLKSCLYYTMYMAYRGYRGFFVILPAVFRKVYQKMETAVDFRVLDDENEDDNASATTTAAGDVNPTTGKIRWRTRITVSVLAGIVTLTYVMGGLARVLMKFVKTILSTSSLSGSFSAAADEVEGNEERLMKLRGNGGNNKGGINGGSKKDLGF